jgi:hypothetical protein
LHVSERIQIRADALEWRLVEGEVVALDLRTHTYLAVNKTGAAIWPALISGTDRHQLVARLVETFGIAREQAAADLDTFLAELAEQDLLQ